MYKRQKVFFVFTFFYFVVFGIAVQSFIVFFNFIFGFICFFYENFIFYNSFFAHICFYYENFRFFICFFFRILRFYISFYFLLLVFLRELTINNSYWQIMIIIMICLLMIGSDNCGIVCSAIVSFLFLQWSGWACGVWLCDICQTHKESSLNWVLEIFRGSRCC